MDEVPEGYARVSDVLSPYSKYDGIDPAILEKAKNRGTLVHKCCELYMLGEYVPPLMEYAGYFDSFCRWFDSVELRDTFLEERFNHAPTLLSGRIDIAAKFGTEEEYTIFDIKTSQSPQKSWGPQLAAYSWLLTQCKELPCSRRVVLHLDKSGRAAKIIEYTEHVRDWRIFKNCLENYKFFN